MFPTFTFIFANQNGCKKQDLKFLGTKMYQLVHIITETLSNKNSEIHSINVYCESVSRLYYKVLTILNNI